MARKRTAEIVITGDASKAQKAMGAVGDAGGRMGRAVKAGGVIAAASLVVIGAGALKVGDQFNQARGSIAKATGATGGDLDGLYADFKNTLGQVPDDMSVVADSIGVANTLFGASGDALSQLTERTLDFSRMAGGDASANMESLGQAAKIFGLDAAGATAGLDDLFKVTQDYNIGGDKLLGLLQQFGPVFSNAGFSMGETATIVGQLHAAGVDLTRVGPALNKFFRDAAQAGKDPQQALAEVESQIRGASSATDALAIATDAFGAEGAQRMVSALRDGGVELSNVSSLLGDNAGLVDSTAAATATLGEKWSEFINGVLVKAEPLITKLFEAFMEGVDWLMDTAVPAVEELVGVFNEDGLAGVFSLVSSKLREAWPQIRTTLGEWARGFVSWIAEAAPPMLSALGNLALQLGQWVLAQAPVWAEQLVEWGKAFVEWVGPQIPPFLREVGRLIGAGLEWLLEEGLPLAVEKLLEFGQAFVEWVGPMIPPMLVEIAKLLAELGTWIVTDAAPTLLSKLGEWTTSFLTWVGTDLIPDVVEKMGELGLALFDWLRTDGITWVAAGLAMVGADIFRFFTEIPGHVWEALSGLGQKIWEALQAAWNFVKDKAGELASIDVPGIDMPDLGNFGFKDLLDPFDIFGTKKHAGGTFLAPRGANEGLALLRAGEFVETPGNARGAASAPAGDIVLVVGGQEWGRWSRQQMEAEGRRGGPFRIAVSPP